MNPLDNPIESAEVELEALIKLFYSESEKAIELGQFQECQPDTMPEVYRQLLAHHHHMTVTVERFHQSPIDLQVLATRTDDNRYSRKILLRRRSDGRGVLFGIVRIDLGVLDEPVRREIEAKRTPLGQVLINHDVMREVRLVGLYQVQPGRDLKHYLVPNLEMGTVECPDLVFGRTAIIFCDGRPVIELLEIVSA